MLRAGGSDADRELWRYRRQHRGLRLHRRQQQRRARSGRAWHSGVTLQHRRHRRARQRRSTRRSCPDDDGRYRFTDLVGGTYAITETQPADYIDGTDSAGTSGGTVGVNVDQRDRARRSRRCDRLFVRRARHSRQRSAARCGATRTTIACATAVEATAVELDRRAVSGRVAGPDARPATPMAAIEFDGVVPGSGYEIRFREPASMRCTACRSRTNAACQHRAGHGRTGQSRRRGPSRRHAARNLTLPPGWQHRRAELAARSDGRGVRLSEPPADRRRDRDAHRSGRLRRRHASARRRGERAAGHRARRLLSVPVVDQPRRPATYSIAVTPPPGRYMPGAVGADSRRARDALQVGAVPNPALVQGSGTAPAGERAAMSTATAPPTPRGWPPALDTTQYFLSFTFTPGASADVLNNHVPIDPILRRRARDHQDDADGQRHARRSRALHDHRHATR